MNAMLMIDRQHKIGDNDGRLFGSLIEHLGRAFNTSSIFSNISFFTPKYF